MRHVEHDAAVPGGGDSDAFRCDEAPRRLDARDRASRTTPDSRNLAIFDDVHARRIAGSGIAPGDPGVAARAPASTDERRVGTTGSGTRRSRWTPSHIKTKT